eukprot:TRINITY_DN4952_c0_g1_i2.p1 TRINITY_DN4952_c0_g1~~TRINITY_DN4952_c0_g1_i2.p1  ORF type:complete len:714 (+),score=285.14 TRINITY_DN4952_c0_g1_i2:39-2180(+)
MKRKDKDAAERQEQREVAEKKRRLEMYGRSSGVAGGGILNIKEIKESWSGVLQKASENKINVKNAWSVNQFESLPMLAKQLGADGDFHTSGVAIESAAKVFSYKVDALLLQSSKVQTAITKGDVQETQESQEQGAETQHHPKEKTRKRRVLTTTIAAPEEINNMKADRTTLVDPLFARTSSRFDQGGASGLLLMNCPFGKFLNVQIDSTTIDMHVNVDTDDAPLNVEGVDLSALEDIKSDAEAEGTEDTAKPERTIEVQVPVAGDAVPLPDPVPAPAPTDTSDDEGGGGGYDLPDMLMDEAPEPMEDDVPLFNVDKEEQKDVEERLHNMDKKADIQMFKDSYLVSASLNLAPEGEAEILEMHQAKQQRGAWQGPFDTNRWRMVRQTQHTQTETARKKKQTNEVVIIEPNDDIANKLKPVKQKESLLLPRGKERLKHFKAKPDDVFTEDFVDEGVSLKYARSSKILLPDDHLVTTEAFFKLNCLPDWNMVHKKQVYQDGTVADHPVLKAEEVVDVSEGLTQEVPPADAVPDDEWGEWGGDDHSDVDDAPAGINIEAEGEEALVPNTNTMTFSSLQETPVLMDIPAEGADQAGHEAALNEVHDTNLELVSRPHEVQKLNIDYAKKAKVVDIKKLKDTMWECLNWKKGRDGKIEKIMFSSLIKSMQALVRERRIAAHIYEISLSLYFISLLHLCNDHNLQITSTSDKMDDILIEAR